MYKGSAGVRVKVAAKKPPLAASVDSDLLCLSSLSLLACPCLLCKGTTVDSVSFVLSDQKSSCSLGKKS